MAFPELLEKQRGHLLWQVDKCVMCKKKTPYTNILFVSFPPGGDIYEKPLKIYGAEEGIRTLDPRLGKAMLYR